MNPLLYAAYESARLLSEPSRITARMTADLFAGAPHTLLRKTAAANRVVARARLTHDRPHFVLGEGVLQTVVDSTPFATLLRFSKPGVTGPKVLLVAPLSGHFATMLSPTVRTLLRDHEVYLTDWHNARDVGLRHGRFGLTEYIEHVMRFLRAAGPDTHLMAVCQPCVPALAAVALLAEDDDPLYPPTLTLMAGPIDARVNPTRVNKAAHIPVLDLMRRQSLTRVPLPYAGAGRLVYPGFIQIGAFMSLAPRRHLDAHLAMYRHLAAGRTADAEVGRRFYREYFAVLDIAADFYLETVRNVFQDHDLARGAMTVSGRAVRPSAITRTALLTVEAARDELCAPGQTDAAHALVPGLSAEQRGRHLQPGVGHYGIFSGRRWDAEVYPVVRDFIASHG